MKASGRAVLSQSNPQEGRRGRVSRMRSLAARATAAHSSFRQLSFSLTSSKHFHSLSQKPFLLIAQLRCEVISRSFGSRSCIYMPCTAHQEVPFWRLIAAYFDYLSCTPMRSCGYRHLNLKIASHSCPQLLHDRGFIDCSACSYSRDVERMARAGVAMMIHEREHHLCLAVALLCTLAQHLLRLKAICRQSCKTWRRKLNVLP